MLKPCTVQSTITWDSSISGLIMEAQDKHLVIMSKPGYNRENSDPTNFVFSLGYMCFAFVEGM